MKHIKHPLKSRGCVLFLTCFFLLALWAAGPRSRTAAPVTSPSAPSLGRPFSRQDRPPDILFQCPDGRLGLHIVHTRVLVSQARVNLIFKASRLQLLHTFLLSCLRGQTNKRFVLYASYDPDLSISMVTALEAALKLAGVHVIMAPESNTAMGKRFSDLTQDLNPIDPQVEKVDLYITSRLDIDDTTHLQSVEAVQEYACSSGDGDRGTRVEDRGSEKESPPPLRVAYVQGGQLWFPSKKGSHPYGEVGIWKTWKERVYDDIYKFLAIMQSMIMSGQDFIRRCEALDVYGYPHYRPTALTNISIPGCPPFEFKPNLKKTNKYMLLWNPPEGDVGNLYVRTASSWTHEKIDLHYHLESANATTLERSFGLSPAALAAANLLFSGLEQRKTSVLLNNSEIPIE